MTMFFSLSHRVLFLCLAMAMTSSTDAFVPSRMNARHHSLGMSTTSVGSTNDDAFSAFADSLEEDVSTSSSRKSSSSTRKQGSSSAAAADSQSWQASIDELLDPLTPLGRRQTLMGDLMNANEDIRQSVMTALRDRKIDPLMTPRSKQLQDGTRSVARQLANDILPTLANPSATIRRGPGGLPFPDPTDVSKVGSRILNALSNQVQRNLETLQGDLADPTRIPKRITQQTETVLTEARNVFSETPVGLEEPPYTLVSSTETYEVRDYAGYTVASTSMGKGAVIVGEAPEAMDNNNIAENGAAFNTLAAYLFGANRQGESMQMTTPVTTTSWGEMRFFLTTDPSKRIPDPLEDGGDSKKSLYDTGAVQIMEIPPARLAVKKFTGFVTDGEVVRQKDALLAALDMDGVELDVAHGDPISHVIFQYNPPYTLPMVRRNEIAVAVRRDDDVDLLDEWGDREGAMQGSMVDGGVTNKVNGATESGSSSATKSQKEREEDNDAPSDVE